MIDSSSWTSGRDETIHRTVGEAQLRKYGNFLNGLTSNFSLSNNSSFTYIVEGPIRLIYEPQEDVSIVDLTEMENKHLAKLLAACGATCREIRLLKLDANRFYKKLLSHGDRCSREKGDVTLLLNDLQDLSSFISRLSVVVNLTIQQLSSLASNNTYEVYLPVMLEQLLDLFIIFITFDEIIDAQPTVLELWDQYCINVGTIMHNSKKFNIAESKLSQFEKLLKDLRQQLLTNNLFLKAIDRAMDVNKSSALQDHLSCYVKNIIQDIERKSGENFAFNKNWIRVNVGIVITLKLFGTIDKRLIKKVSEINKKYYSVTLIDNIIWFPQKFIVTLIPKEAGSTVTSQIGEKILESKIRKFSEVVATLAQKAISWSVEIHKLALNSVQEFQLADLERKCSLLMEFLNVIHQIKENILFVTNLHAALSKPMSRNVVLLICRLVEIQKCLETTFHSHGPIIVQSQSQVIQYLSYQILIILETVNKGLVLNDKAYSRKQLDVLSLISLSKRLISGPPTEDRRLLARCALATATQMTDNFRDDEITKLRNYLDAYNAIAELYFHVKEICDYSVILHHQSMLPAYLNMVMDSNSDISHIVYLFNALNTAIANEEFSYSSESRTKELRDILVRTILEPASHEIETSLRLHVHAHLKLDDANPFKVGAKDSNRIIRASPLPIGNRFISPKRFVEHYLDEMFYNLTTVALHDWRTYGTMRRLAKYKLGLEMINDHLPTQNLEQGLDALEIMRNIDTFVSKYLYNLNTQTFIERTSPNKYLNTIGIRHIANSIRTHGNGIMSTTVNFVYQFLKAKLHTFSQFLFDEHIKSRLMRDVRFIKQQRENGRNPYTYERAERFQKSIRKLGMTNGGLSYLDKFRNLITQIGNALGYVRLIRSGGLYACSNAISFLPDVNSVVSFETACDGLDFSETTRSAGKRLDDDISNLKQSFADGTQYFRVLVDVFASAFRDVNNFHLQQFYAIVPPLTLSFVDNALANKEKIFKKNKFGAAFTDDGFAMGVAYIIALLDQSHDIDGLQWFKTVKEQIAAERIVARALDDTNDKKLQQTGALTLKRLAERNSEFQLLHYSLSGTRVFFKQPDASSASLNN